MGSGGVGCLRRHRTTGGPLSKQRAVKTPRESSARYPIRAVSKLTGIGIDTLRAWERRHQAVAPVRDDRGRMYSEADVARLRLLAGAVAHGHSIGRLAGLGDEALRHIAATAQPVAAPATDRAGQVPVDTALLSRALRAYDAQRIDLEIARLAGILRPLELLRDVVMPLLVQVGDQWHQGRAGVAHERLMSTTIRNILGSLLRLHGHHASPVRVLFATPSGERHEIGTLGAALLAASSGLGVTFLGPDLPAGDIIESVKTLGAEVLVLGVTTTSAGKAKERELNTIVRSLPKNVELWTGGPGAVRHAAIIGRRGLVLPDYDAYQRELVRIGGRAETFR